MFRGNLWGAGVKIPIVWKNIRDCNGLLYCLHETARIEITDLMKEMAEALEYVARGPHPDDSEITVAKQALQRFESWT